MENYLNIALMILCALGVREIIAFFVHKFLVPKSEKLTNKSDAMDKLLITIDNLTARLQNAHIHNEKISDELSEIKKQRFSDLKERTELKEHIKNLETKISGLQKQMGDFQKKLCTNCNEFKKKTK